MAMKTTHQRSSGENILNMKGTSTTATKQQSKPAVEEVDCSKEFSHLTLSDHSIVQPTDTVETRPSSSEAVNITNHPETQTQQRNMKLIVRSQYWGRTLKGRTNRTEASLNRPFRTISSQAVLYNTDEYWGCCPHHGKRVLELQECHFQDYMPGSDWDLYAVQSWVSPTHSINDFFLLPQQQNIIDVSRNIILSGWTFIGTCTTGSIRDDLDSYLRPWLEQNDSFGYRYHHVHIEIMMHSAFDRETPRSRKVNNERARQERQHQKGSGSGGSATGQEQSSESTTDDELSAKRDGPPSVPGNPPFVLRTPNHHHRRPPPIPQTISNDSSSVFSHSVAGSAMTATPYHDVHGGHGGYHHDSSFWSPHTAAGNMHHHPHHQNPHMGMQWHPGGVHPSATPPTSHPHHPSPAAQYGAWQAPPPPPLHGHGGPMPPSPALSHGSHVSATELQQYLMYSDGTNMPPPPPPQYYHNMPPPPSPSQHSYSSNLDASILQGYVPSEILGHTSLSGIPVVEATTTPNYPVASTPTATTAKPPPTSAATADTEVALSVSTAGTTPVEDSLVIGDDAVVTTIATSNMVSSRCWSPTGKKSIDGFVRKHGYRMREMAAE